MNHLEVNFLPANANQSPVFVLKGHFKTLEAIEFKETLLATLAQPNIEALEIDLLNVSEIDITALNSLVMGQRTANKLHKKMLVHTPKNHPIYGLLAVTQFSHFLNTQAHA